MGPLKPRWGVRKHQLMGFAALICICTLSLFFNNCAQNFNASTDSSTSNSSGNGGDSGNGGLVDNRPTTCTVPPVTINHTQGFVANQSQTIFIDTNQFPLAVCNDGTPAVFSVRPGFGAAASRWVLWLDGGASCYDDASCQQRVIDFPDLITSNSYKTTALGENFGPLNPDPVRNPDLYDATAVRIHYCSSDGWTGNKAGDPNQPNAVPEGWHFRGHEIVKAVVQTLKNNYNFNSATELLFVGSSAGGVGVFNNVSWLSQNIPTTTRFVASTDAGFINEVSGYDQTQPDGVSKAPGTPYDAVNPLEVALWGASGDMYCEAKAVSMTDHIHCGMGPLLAAKDTGYIRVPMFIRQSEADGVQLKQEGLDIQSNPPKQQSQGYQQFFGTQMIASLNNANNFVTVFAGADNIHGEMDQPFYYQKVFTFGSGASQVSLRIVDALGIWYKNPCQLNSWIQ